MEQILSSLYQYEILLKSQQKVPHNEEKTQVIITILSMGDVEYTDVLAHQAAVQLSASHSVLCMDFSQFRKAGEVEEQGQCLSDLIYYLKEERELKKIPFGNAIGRTKHFQYIRPVRHGLDLLEIERAEIPRLLELIAEHEYDTVVVQISLLSEASVELIGMSSKIIYIRNLKMPNDILNSVKHQLVQVLGDEVSKRFYEIEVPLEYNETAVNKQLGEILGDVV